MKGRSLLCLLLIFSAATLLSCSPQPILIPLSAITDSETVTEAARDGLIGSAAEGEVIDVKCEIDYNTMIYSFYYNPQFTEDMINDQVIEIWDQYVDTSSAFC